MASTVSRETVLSALEQPQKLPTLPSVYSALQEAAQNPRASFKDLTDAIAKDPVTAARILQVANSSYYGLKEPAEELATAVTYLGFIEIQRIALSVGAFQLFSVPGQQRDFLGELWLHSLSTAMIGRQFGEWAGAPNPENVYLGGLIHDIGKVFFAGAFTSEYIRMEIEVVEQGGDVLAVETARLGVTHIEAAHRIVQHWKMPPHLASAIECHHDPTALNEEDRVSPLCVGAANLLSHLVLKDENVSERMNHLHCFLSELQREGVPAESIGIEAALDMAREVVAQARQFDRAMDRR